MNNLTVIGTTEMGPDGTITLPEKVINVLGISEGDTITFTIKDGYVIISKSDIAQSLFGSIPSTMTLEESIKEHREKI